MQEVIHEEEEKKRAGEEDAVLVEEYPNMAGKVEDLRARLPEKPIYPNMAGGPHAVENMRISQHAGPPNHTNANNNRGSTTTVPDPIPAPPGKVRLEREHVIKTSCTDEYGKQQTDVRSKTMKVEVPISAFQNKSLYKDIPFGVGGANRYDEVRRMVESELDWGGEMVLRSITPIDANLRRVDMNQIFDFSGRIKFKDQYGSVMWLKELWAMPGHFEQVWDCSDVYLTCRLCSVFLGKQLTRANCDHWEGNKHRASLGYMGSGANAVACVCTKHEKLATSDPKLVEKMDRRTEKIPVGELVPGVHFSIHTPRNQFHEEVRTAIERKLAGQ